MALLLLLESLDSSLLSPLLSLELLLQTQLFRTLHVVNLAPPRLLGLVDLGVGVAVGGSEKNLFSSESSNISSGADDDSLLN